jgi:hypothetical protein
MSRPAPERSTDFRRQAALTRSLTLRSRVNRLYALVDAAERRAAQRHREVQVLRASAQLLCERAVRVGRATADESGADGRLAGR